MRGGGSKTSLLAEEGSLLQMTCWQDGKQAWILRAGPSVELANSSVGHKLLNYRIKSLERLSKDRQGLAPM